MTETNQQPDVCTECGALVEVGQGMLWYEQGPDDGGDVVGGTPAGWRVTHLDRDQCARHRASMAEAGRRDRERARHAAAEAHRRKNAEIAAQEAFINSLLVQVENCTSAGYCWYSVGVLDQDFREPVTNVQFYVPENPALAGLDLGRSHWERRRTLDGRDCYVHSFGNARVLHAPRDVVEAAWRAYAEHYEISRDKAVAWLAAVGPESDLDAPRIERARARKAVGESYSPIDLCPCAGWELYAFVAGRRDLLERYGDERQS